MLTSRFDEIVGGWTFFKEMATRLSKRGHDVTVISPRLLKTKPYETLEKISIYRVRVLHIPSVPLIIPDYFSLVSAIQSALKLKEFDLVYDTTFMAYPFSFLAFPILSLIRPDIPWISHACGELRDMGRSITARFLFRSYLRLVAKLVLPRVKRVLVAGKPVYNMAANLGVAPNKLSIVRLGPMHEISAVKSKSDVARLKRKIRSSLGLSIDDFVVASIGRLHYGKRVDVIIRAVAKLQKTRKNIKLLIIGAGPEEHQLKTLARGQTDNIRFLGWRLDISDLLNAIDVYVSTSDSEAGMSSSLLEAMMAGLPCIVTPFTRAITNMRDGLVIPFQNPTALAEAIDTLYQNPELRTRFRAVVKRTGLRMAGQYSWDDYVYQVERIFEELDE